MPKKSIKEGASASANALDIIIRGPQAHQAREAQAVQDVQEVQTAQGEQRTQGRKGMKMQRINMAFTPANIDYIRVMAAIRGQTMTQFVNAIIAADKAENGDAYEAAKKITEGL